MPTLRPSDYFKYIGIKPKTREGMEYVGEVHPPGCTGPVRLIPIGCECGRNTVLVLTGPSDLGAVNVAVMPRPSTWWQRLKRRWQRADA